MGQKDDRSVNKKIGSWIEVFKNAQFIVLNVLLLAVLAFAFFTGNGRQVALNFYAGITGQQAELFVPVENNQVSSKPYEILKYKLLQDKDVNIENVEVRFFKESETSYRYRVVLNDAVLVYAVKKNRDGIWQINTVRE